MAWLLRERQLGVCFDLTDSISLYPLIPSCLPSSFHFLPSFFPSALHCCFLESHMNVFNYLTMKLTCESHILSHVYSHSLGSQRHASKACYGLLPCLRFNDCLDGLGEDSFDARKLASFALQCFSRLHTENLI